MDFWNEVSEASEAAEFHFMNAGERRAEAGMSACVSGYDIVDVESGAESADCRAVELTDWVAVALASFYQYPEAA